MAEFTHLDEEGRVRMVDVTAKAATVRTALAGGEVRMRAGEKGQRARSRADCRHHGRQADRGAHPHVPPAQHHPRPGRLRPRRDDACHRHPGQRAGPGPDRGGDGGTHRRGGSSPDGLRHVQVS
jgi:hypothetical protein